jgi:hypothetical protein
VTSGTRRLPEQAALVSVGNGRPIGEQIMIRKSTAMALAVSATLLFPLTALAQGATGTTGTATSPAGTPNAGSAGAGTSAVNGIPPGPGRPGGVNNSVADPSGIGNAGKVPPLATSKTNASK